MPAYLEDSESGAFVLQSPQHQKPVDSVDDKYNARSPTASEIDLILNPTDSDSEVCASTDSVYGKYNPMSPTASETDLILDAPNLPAEVLMKSNFFLDLTGCKTTLNANLEHLISMIIVYK